MSSQSSDRAFFRTSLAKEDFKFSCAHFTVFSATEAEPLHGHNYQVAVEIEGDEVDSLEFLVEFTPVKRRIRELCDGLDESVLLPSACEHLSYSEVAEGHLRVDYANRSYTFPRSEVREMPLRNITVEGLARYVWDGLAPTLAGTLVRRLCVEVGETAGQASRYEAPVPLRSSKDLDKEGGRLS